MTLFKNANNRVNYYKINVYPTLFGDYLIQKEYGTTNHKKPTQIIKEYVKATKKHCFVCSTLLLIKKVLVTLKPLSLSYILEPKSKTFAYLAAHIKNRISQRLKDMSNKKFKFHPKATLTL